MKKELLLPKELIDAFKKLDTPSISDAMDKLRIPCGLLNIKPVVPDTYMCGQAFTVHYLPNGEIKGTVGDFIDDIEEGEVAVLDNNGRLDCTVWGDIMSIYATKKGIAGTVIDGVCRDINVIRELKYPIYTKGTYMVTGKDRVFVDRINEPVTIAGIQVCPGDLICGDNTGVVVVPRIRAEEVLQVALEIEKVESQIVEKVKAGMSLKEARQQTGYHTLQTPDK
ncbi:MAG: RraA family protein [Solobacterium sp.]|nr:RraA family protein [Solobacterium sp.]